MLRPPPYSLPIDPQRPVPTRVAADMIGVSARTLETWRLTGGGPVFLKVGASVRYRPADIATWLDACARRHTSESAR